MKRKKLFKEQNKKPDLPNNHGMSQLLKSEKKPSVQEYMKHTEGIRKAESEYQEIYRQTRELRVKLYHATKKITEERNGLMEFHERNRRWLEQEER